MKKHLFALLLLFLPMLALAATTDFTANGDVTVSSVTFGSGTADMLILNGSTAESWSFSSGAFTVTNPGTFKVGSSDTAVKSIQFSSGGTTLACSENSTAGTSFATAPTAAGTYTVTPSTVTQCTNLCSAVANAASFNSFPTCGAASCNTGFILSGSGATATCAAVSGGGPIGGSGGFSANVQQPRPQIIYPDGRIVYLDEGNAAQTGVQPSVSGLFTENLSRDMHNSDVSRLQQLLASDPSLYPEGLITGYFGALTEQAVQRFQAKYGIVRSGTPDSTGYGSVGPKTRVKLQEVFGNATAPSSKPNAPSSQTSAPFSQTLRLDSTGEEVKKLQEFLNSDPDTRLAESGIGSPGNESDYFGRRTEDAVRKFQTKYGIVQSGAPDSTGYGLVGPKTRAKLNELSFQ